MRAPAWKIRQEAERGRIMPSAASLSDEYRIDGPGDCCQWADSTEAALHDDMCNECAELAMSRAESHAKHPSHWG